MPRVSVIIPNYNHAPFLNWRIDTVLDQTFRDLEILILDDASTDGSQAVIDQYRDRPRVRIEHNEKNSGSVFRQWEKGILATDSEYVWIAESDDWTDPRFLATLIPLLESKPKIGAAYTQSWLADLQFKITGHASCWTDDIDAARWRSNFIAAGRTEIARFLTVKNTIPNASAVLMRRSVLQQVLPIDTSFRLCGDWLHWIRMLAVSDVAFVAEPLNFWRQRSSNARTEKPGVLEWREGERILLHACDVLGLPQAERDRILLAFLRKCWDWATAPAVV
jgi:glycosyltransferase involved in cell wall biosynthesis